MPRIIFYTAKNSGCKPCEEIGKLVEEGKFASPDGEVDFVDIMTDEGFKQFSDEILSKQDGAVPSAYLDGKQCRILVADDVVYFECPNSDQPSGQEQKQGPVEIVGEHTDAQPSLPAEPPVTETLPDYTTGTFPQ